jgi:hypothetical protein
MCNKLVGLALAIAVTGLPLANVLAAGGSFTRGCAARDMQVLMLIEQQEVTREISNEKAKDAVLSMMHARMICFEGNVSGALSLYDDIVQTLSTDWALSGQSRLR